MKIERSQFFFTLFIVLAVVYIAAGGWLYPMQGDDFAFCAGVRDRGVFTMVKEMYLTWTLRTGEVFNFFLLIFHKTLFNIINPFMQLFLVWSLFFFGFRRTPDWKNPDDCRIFAVLLAMSCFCVARPRDTVYWMTGSSVYTLGCALWFTFWGVLNRSRDVVEKSGTVENFAVFLLGLLSACALENAMALGVLLVLVYAVHEFRRRVLPCRFAFSALAGYIAGVVITSTAPGRWVRAAEEGAVTGISGKIKIIPEIAVFWGGSAWFALVVLIFAAAVLFLSDRKKFRQELFVCGVLLAMSVISDAAFIAGGVTPAVRAYLFSSLLISLAAARIMSQIPGAFRKNILAAICCLYAVLLMVSAIPDFLAIYRDSAERSRIIRNAQVQDVTVPAHRTVRRNFLQYIWIEDYTASCDNPFNINAARYYRLKSIRTEAAPETVLFWKRKQ